jgi:hypothetical protein
MVATGHPSLPGPTRSSGREARLPARFVIASDDESDGGYKCEMKYGWMPHNASFGFLDLTPAKLGQIHF